MIKGRDDGILIGEIIRFKETAWTVHAEEKRQIGRRESMMGTVWGGGDEEKGRRKYGGEESVWRGRERK